MLWNELRIKDFKRNGRQGLVDDGGRKTLLALDEVFRDVSLGFTTSKSRETSGKTSFGTSSGAVRENSGKPSRMISIGTSGENSGEALGRPVPGLLGKLMGNPGGPPPAGGTVRRPPGGPSPGPPGKLGKKPPEGPINALQPINETSQANTWSTPLLTVRQPPPCFRPTYLL